MNTPVNMKTPVTSAAPAAQPAVAAKSPPPPPPAELQKSPRLGTDQLKLDQPGEPATLEPAALPWDKAKEALGGLTDALGEFKDELPKQAMSYFKLNQEDLLAARDLKGKLGYGNTDIRQFFDGSCVAATSQQAWAESDPEGYQASRDGLTAEPYALNLPHPPGGVNPVTTLSTEEVDYLKAQAEAQGLSDAETRDFFMQYGLMKFAAEAGPNPQATEPGAIEDGSQDAGLPAEKGRETTGLDWFQTGWMNDAIFGPEGGPAVNRGALQNEAGLSSLGEEAADPAKVAEAEKAAATQVEEKAAAKPGALLTVDNGQGGGHQVMVVENPDQPGTYIMSDANGEFLPEGCAYPQPLTLDQVVELMAIGKDLGDSGARGGNKGSGGEANYG